MARFRAMVPGKPQRAVAAEPAAKSVPAQSPRDVLPPIHPDTDMLRYERLAQVRIIGVDARFKGPALLTARRLRCQMAASSGNTDAESTARIAHYVVSEAERTGELNYKRIFRRAAVDRYLEYHTRRLTPRTMRTLQNQLYAAGRLVHPQEFPRKNALGSPHVRRARAATLADIDHAYAIAPTLPAAMRRDLMILLDLCFGAGARANDFKMLKGASITQASWEGEALAVVHLPNRDGSSRSVPVADREISARLIDLAKARGSNYLLASPGCEVERNAANRISERLRDRGIKSLSAAALRNRWLLELAVRVPAALMLQLADVETAQILSDQRDQLPTYGLQHAIAITKEAF